MKFSVKLRLALGLLLLGLGLGAQAQVLEFVVSGNQTGAQPISLVPFADNEGMLDIAAVVESDLKRSGIFNPIPRGDMLENPHSPAEIDYRNWRALNSDYLVVGSLFQDDASGAVTVRFFLLDVYKGQQLLGFDMPAVQASQLRVIAHQIADMIYEKVTGIPGIFNTKIAYVTAVGFGPKRTFHLYIADADGENPQEVATSREPLMSPSWSPDRSKLAYVGFDRGNSAIFIHELATGRVRKLSGEKGINGSPAWSPDGRQLAVTLSFGSNPDIYIINPETMARRRITDHYAIDTEAAWAPDGQSLVFTSDRGGNPQIYRVPASGGQPTRVTFEGRQNLRANFSPDGKNITLVNYDQGSYRIGLLNLETARMNLISDGPLDESPSFAPNGAFVVYSRQAGGGAELATVTVDGRYRQQLRQRGDVREPAWSPLVK